MLELPNDILQTLFAKLTPEERMYLANVSRRFFNFYSLTFSTSPYAKASHACEFMQKELSRLTSNITIYKESQRISIFNLPKASPKQIRNFFKFGLIGVFFMWKLYSSFANNIDHENLSRNILRVIVLLVVITTYISYTNRHNNKIANLALDDHAIEKLNTLLLDKHVLFGDENLNFNYRAMTHGQVNNFLDNLANDIQMLINNFDEYRNSLFGENVRDPNLHEISSNPKNQKILKCFIEQFNEKNKTIGKSSRCIRYNEIEDKTDDTENLRQGNRG